MNKKTKKQISVLRERIHTREQQLAAAKAQADSPTEIAVLQREIETLRNELKRLQELN